MQEENIFLGKEENTKLFGKPEKYDYTKFAQIEGFNLDDELINKFAPIAQKLNLSQSSVEMLLEIALEMSKKQNEMREIEENQKQEKTLMDYQKRFSEDENLPSLNSLQIKEYMRIADSAYNEFVTPELKEIFKNTGLIYHPELIKMFHKIGELQQEDDIGHYGQPACEELSPAQILYGPRN